jgi:hypothetical protein
MARLNFIGQQTQLWMIDNEEPAAQFVHRFRLHYPNLSSFSSSISRFKSDMRKAGAPAEFLDALKPTKEETAEVHLKNKVRLELKCRESITLRNCGDNLIMTLRQFLESSDLGKLMVGLQATTGLRMLEVVCRANIETPKLNHDHTDDIYWSWVTGVCKKHGSFSGHERPLLHRRDIIQAALRRLRRDFFQDIQECDDNIIVSRRVCTKINRAIRKVWPFPEVKRVTSHFFRSFYVASTFHYFNERSSLSAWACDVLAHETLTTSFPYTGLLITGYGSLSFDTERALQGMARLRIDDSDPTRTHTVIKNQQRKDVS